MQNFIQPANTIGISAPRNLAAGDGVVKGKIFGVAANPAASGKPVQVSVEGAFAFKRAGGVTLNEGDPALFDETTQTLVGTGGKAIGYCIEAEASEHATGYSLVKLIPTAV